MEADTPTQTNIQKKRKPRRRQPPLCEYCHKSFSRVEHLQRHLRTHTNEKPFTCSTCSKTFGRSDLLNRHKKLVHVPQHVEDTTPRVPSRSCQPSTSTSTRQMTEPWTENSQLTELQRPDAPVAGSSDLLLLPMDEPTQSMPAMYPYDRDSTVNVVDSHYDDAMPFSSLGNLENPMQDFNAFLESIGLSLDWEPEVLPSEHLQGASIFQQSRPQPFEQSSEMPRNAEGSSNRRLMADETPFSNFGSRLPSLQPESRAMNGGDSNGTCLDVYGRDHYGALPEPKSRDMTEVAAGPITRSIYDIGKHDYQSYVRRLDHARSIWLPTNFPPTSRYSLSRYMDGFIDGLNEHLPFMHAPTIDITSCNPALVLAIAACGSQYRFENHRGIELFHAAKVMLLDELHRRGYMKLPTALQGQLDAQQISDLPPTSGDLIELIQILLLLTIYATWGKNSDRLQEILSLQPILASMIREHGLDEAATPFELDTVSDDCNWHRWIKQEGARRTKLVAYTFHNLHSLMYNNAPLILTSDLSLDLPCPTAMWKACSAAEWRRAYDSSPRSIPFQTSFTLLFSRPPVLPTSLSFSTPLGNHVLMHAILQQIYFTRQLYVFPPLKQLLRAEDLTVLEDVLRSWKLRWQQTPESSTNPRNPAGPIAFTSSSLLGQAYVRLYLNTGPYRALMSLNPAQIADTLNSAPAIVRTPGLVMALLHAAHALSIPVRLGIDFVARTHSLYWSIQHSLSSLEYAFLLSRWLLALPDCGPSGLSGHERLLFLWIKRIVDETDMAIHRSVEGESATMELAKDATKMRQMAQAIVRIWVRTFKGNTCWGIVDLVGSGLEAYSNLLEHL